MYSIDKVGKRLRHTIPVTQPVQKYLERIFPDLYELTKYNFLGMWLINAMVKKTVQVQTFDNKADDMIFLKNNRMTYSWQFITPIRYNDSFVFPKRQVLRLNAMIRKFIHVEIIHDIETMRRSGDIFYIQRAINNFRDRYQIRDTELNDEQIRKMYLRFRQKNKTVSSEFSEFSPAMLLG
jgi:hypothetical protein